MQHNNVCITGIGAATPLGNDYETIAANLLNGQSGVRPVTRFPVKDHPSQIAAEIDYIPCPDIFQNDDFAGLPRPDQLMLWCAGSGPARCRLVGPARRCPDRHHSGHGNRVADDLGDGFFGRRRKIAQPHDREDSVAHRTRRAPGFNRAGRQHVGRLCQRQLRAGAGAAGSNWAGSMSV